jgi:hypothetical protein
VRDVVAILDRYGIPVSTPKAKIMEILKEKSLPIAVINYISSCFDAEEVKVLLPKKESV